jgi:hypothetical protein
VSIVPESSADEVAGANLDGVDATRLMGSEGVVPHLGANGSLAAWRIEWLVGPHWPIDAVAVEVAQRDEHCAGRLGSELTALIIDAYNAVAEAVEAADAAYNRSDLHGRFRAIATSLRTWAQTHPHEYGLIFGSPVPGYEAPQDTIDPAARVPFAIISVIVEARSGEDAPSSSPDPDLVEALSGLDGFTGGLLTTDVLRDAVAAWAQIFGLVSLELFGHLKNSVAPDGVLFDRAIGTLATGVLTPERS